MKLTEYSYHKDPKTVRLHEMEGHAYFIPFDASERAGDARETSPYFHSLGGDWRFLWKPSVYDMEEFFEEGYDCSAFETVCVPEVWQAHGKDRAQYQTSPYPFVFDPPYVPEKNPCAAYVKEFFMEPVAGKRYELHIEGKDSCAYIWMNGSFVGYGEVPHNDSSFDVTPYLRKGENRLCILVMKWCTGTYFDDQDKLRLSGLFREVYLLERQPAGIEDFRIRTSLDGTVALSVRSKAEVMARIWDGGTLLWERTLCDGQGSMTISAPRLWSAETPNLYTLELVAAGEYIRHRFGIRTTEIKDGVFCVNGRAVKLYGANRHDSSPDVGYAVDMAHMRRDIVLMKQHNINAIRTSHYPNDPRFYGLCDELGMYVLSEADLECHGCTYPKPWNQLVDDELWETAVLDRIRRMHDALKNHTCIVIWSLGNESSWGKNLRKAAVCLRQWDENERPIHYQVQLSAYESMNAEEQEEVNRVLDFFSLMYPGLDQLDGHLQNETIPHPFLICEYSHSMGNSCGDLRFYDEYIQREPRFTGGFIWEWCDHALRIKDESEREFLGYGGDFGEKHHGRNICMDGLVDPDRKPHSNLLEAKAVFAPVRITRDEDGQIRIQNRHAFSDLSRYDIAWEIVLDGVRLDGGVLAVNPKIGESVAVSIPTERSYIGECAVLYVRVKLAEEQLWAPKGHEVAAASFALPSIRPVPPRSERTLSLTETRTSYVVTGEGFRFAFRKDEGVLGEWQVNGREVLRQGMRLNCFRAPTDNDSTKNKRLNVSMRWQSETMFGNIEYTEWTVKRFSACVEDGVAKLSGELVFGVQGRRPIATGNIEYTIDGEGRLTIRQTGSISEQLPYFLPRYGYCLSLADRAKDVRYCGYGPTECYEDKRMCALLGEYDYLPDDPNGTWEKPQECGSHCDTRWVRLRCADTVLRVSGEGFSFCASDYDLHEVAAAKHRKDLKRLSGTELYIDWRMSGVGSASCNGQVPVETCRINAGEQFDFTVTLEAEQ